ncbi:LuxR family transcriptional regulator [Shinella granuli]|uniref:LuxR family transcriptional activator of conjugal transfer of Ti plasmids n=1 Tax=Shinella granuli TaxID=323621 RepID=A0A4R2C627_SHIGR|nr:autoinducer binding domain-containing protein [Shinella granuli]EZQ12945.1 transcriptional regulator [Halopseudomonas bauzanensis]TCN35651.1 LuxR family transcriptional activator of conjugal transfer of Ti plasmids [Shinella granuli]
MHPARRTNPLSDQISGLLEALELNRDERAVRAALHKFTVAAGLQRFAYVGVSSDGARTLTDLPQVWEDYYLDAQLSVVDPVVKQARKAATPFWWSLARMDLTEPVARKYRDEIGDFGVVSGMTIPMRAGFGRTAMLTFMSESDMDAPYNISALKSAVAAVAYTHMHVSNADFAARQMLSNPLTPRELDCVMWTSLGKTKAEIAQMHGISEKTVRFHIDNAQAKLKATNGPHMVRIALDRGLISRR